MTETPHSERTGRRWGVPVAEVVLVGAVWLSLRLAGGGPGIDDAMAGPPVALPDDLPGFATTAWYLPDDGMLGLVEVPGGLFTMGSDPRLDPLAYEIERWSATAGQGTVDVPTFYMSRFEVTVAQYAAFVAATGHPLVEAAALDAPPDHPVANVSWTDALAYARWLDGRLRESPETPEALSALVANGWHVALPTEAQWEKAARGDSGRIFPWGDEPVPGKAVFNTRATAPVGSTECPRVPVRPLGHERKRLGVDPLTVPALPVRRGRRP